MSTFTLVNDDTLISTINRVQSKLVFVAPGISERVAEALGARFSELGRLSITVILDVDPEVCRLGYGDIPGLRRIKALADASCLELRHQPGVRLGLLIADRETLIYSPTPLLIEAGSRRPDNPNAIVIRGEPLRSVEQALATADDALPDEAEIGRKVVANEDVDAVARDLKENPPKKFDIARVERVFNSRIQYVEFNVERYRLSSKVAPIPPDLMGVGDDADLLERWRNTFRMFDLKTPFVVVVPELNEQGAEITNVDGGKKTVQYSEKRLEKEKAQLVKDYLFVVPNFDTVILRARRAEFDAQIKRFEKRLADFKAAVEAQLEAELDKSIEKIIAYLAPRVLKNPPARYRKASLLEQADTAEIQVMLAQDLREAFGLSGAVFDPRVTVRFKDVTYESIHDPRFRDALEKVMPEATMEKLFSEYDAALAKVR